MHATTPRILVLIPAFNEGEAIADVVRGVAEAELGAAVQVLVIDDGSDDDTACRAAGAGARVVTLLRNLGYGYALQTGYIVAVEEGFDCVVQMDGDGQHTPESIPQLVRPVLDGRADVVLGSRGLSTDSYRMPWARRLGQSVFRSILAALSGLRIADPTSGFQALGPRALALVTQPDFPGDYPDADTLLSLHLRGVRIEEVPARFRENPRGSSMHGGVLKPMYYIYKMLLSLILVRVRHRRSRVAIDASNGVDR